MVDYSSFIDAVSTQDKAARQSISSDQSPDDAARSFQLERASGVPAASIAQDIPAFEAEHKAQLGQKIVNDNPDISGFINAHPLHGQLVSDDLGSLDEYSRAYRRIAPGGHPLTEAAKGFAEGFGNVGEIGQEYPRFLKDADKYPTATALLAPVGIPLEMIGRVFRGVTASAYKAAKALGVNAGMGEQDAGKLADDLAGLLEYELMKPSAKLPTEPAAMRPRVPEEILPPEAKPAAPGGLRPPPETIDLEAGPTDMSRRSFLQGAAALAVAPKGLVGKALEAAKPRLVDPQTPYAIARQTLYGLHEDVGQAADHLLDLAGDAFKEHGSDSLVGRVNTLASELIRSGQVTSSGINVEAIANAIRQQVNTARPFLEAGERPPPGVIDVVDEIEAQHTELSSKATDEVIAARDKTALAERSPEKLEEFTQGLPKGSTRIAVDAFVKIPPDKFDWIPDLEQRLASGATSITVPTNIYIAKIEKEIHDEIKEFVSHGEDLSPAEVNELKETPRETPRMRFERELKQIEATLPPIPEGMTRLWRGNRLGEVGQNPSFTNDAAGIALPFRQGYGGNLSYIDVLEAEKYLQTGVVAAGAEFRLPPELASKAKIVDHPLVEPVLQTIRDGAGFTAYHASPHDFDRFDFSKMGTGEGAQSYGAGGYFAENPAVSGRGGEYDKSFTAQIGRPAHIYEVSIKADPEHFLDWDKPLSEQHPKVKEAIQGIEKNIKNKAFWRITENDMQDIRRQIAREATTVHELESALRRGIGDPQKTMDIFREAGIPGIRYLDQGSRGTFDLLDLQRSRMYWEKNPGPEATQKIQEIDQAIAEEKNKPRTSNYVVFDDSLIDITHKDGKPVDQALRARILERGRSGRPIRREPLPIGTEEAILEAGAQKVAEGAGDEVPPPFRQGIAFNGPIFTKGAAIGRTQREMSQYEKLIAQRDAEDVEWRLRRAQAQAERENSQAWKDEARAITSEVRDEISSRPEIAVYRFFQDGVAFGNKLARRPKINEASLTEAQRAYFPKQFIAPRGRGYDPDAVANLFGFSDSDSLVVAVSALEGEATAGRGDIVDRLVDAEVNRRVDAKLGESAQERLDEAYDHALSQTQMELIHERMLQLGTQVGTSIPISPMATKLGALNLLHQELFGGMSSRRFLNDAGRFGRRVEKALLSNDPAEAFKSAQAQYIAAEMAKEARQVEKETKVFDRLEKRYRQREVAGRDPEYTNWIHDNLYRIGEGRRDPADIKNEIDNSAHSTFQSFLDSKAAMGREIYVAEHLLDPTFGKNLEEMSVLEARQTMATLRSLDKVSRDENRFEIEGQKRDRKALLDEMVEKLESLGVATVVEHKPGRWDKVRSAGRTYLAHTLQMESLLNRWDRGNAFGVFNQWIGRPLIEAANSEAVLQRQIAKAYRDLPGQLTREELNKTVPNTLFRDPIDAWQSEGKYDFSGAEPIPFTRKHLRAVMLNVGNPSNLKKLADGYQIKPEQILDWLNTYAKKEDWDWAQAHGDMFQTLKDMSDRMYRNLSGVAPESIEVSGIQTPHGNYRGWYHPLIYDPIWRGERMAPAKPKDLFEPEYFRANTPASYTKARTGYVAPIDLSLDQVPSRLTQEIHDISFHEPVVQASKLLYDSRFLNVVTKYYGRTFSDMFQPWLKDIANAKNYTGANQAAAAQWITWFRSNMIGTFVGLNLGTIEKHTVTALANSIKEVGGTAFRDAAASLYNDNGRGETNWAFAMRTFDELQRRHQNFMETVSGAQETALGEAGLRETMLQFGTKPVAFFDLLSAVPTALAAYKTALEEGGSLGDAVYAGNRAVRRAHGSTAITSRTAVQRDYPSVAILYNFMSRMAQYQYEYAWKARDILTGQAQGKKAEYGKNIMIGLFVSVFFVGLVDTLVSDVDEKDTWESLAGKSLATGIAAPWIGGREVMHAMTHKSDPMLGAGSSELKMITDAFRDVNRKDLGLSKDRLGKTVKHVNNLMGLATGLTNAEIGNLAEYIIDLNSGKAKPHNAGDWWRGLRRGRIDKPTSEENALRLIEGGKR